MEISLIDDAIAIDGGDGDNAARSKQALVQVGDVFGRLTVESVAERRGKKGSFWKCRCECGKTAYRCTNDLRRRQNNSCGCAKARHKWTDEIDERIVRLRATCSIGEISQRVGIPYEAIRSRLRLLDSPIKRRPPRSTSKPEKLGYLEWAPGHFATDLRSYELIVGGGR